MVLERARELEPDKGSVRETLARAYYSTRRFGDAKAEFARAIELDPVNDYAHFGLGLACCAPATMSAPVGTCGSRRLCALRPEYLEALARVVDPAVAPDAADGAAGDGPA